MALSTYSIRSAADLWSFIEALQFKRNIIPKFEKGFNLSIRVPAGIDELKRAEAILALNKVMRRSYAMLRYGSANLSLLTKADRAETTITVQRTHDNKELIIDFSGAFNACARAVQTRCELDNAPDYAQTEFPEHLPPYTYASSAGRKDIGHLEASRDVVVTWLRRASPKAVAAAGFMAVAFLAVALTTCSVVKAYLDHDLQVLAENHRHQERLAELEELQITTKDGRTVQLNSNDQRNLRHDVDHDSRRLAKLIADHAEEPYLQFVKNQIDDAYPILLDLALAGTIDYNGLSFDAKIGKHIARKARKSATNSIGGWKTKVRRSPLIS